MKLSSDYSLKPLNSHPDPIRRRNAFINFVSKAKLILRAVPELRQVLAHFPTIGAPTNDAANKAFSYFIHAHIDPNLQDMLLIFDAQHTTPNDGVAEFNHIHSHCSSQDHDERQRNMFEYTRLRPRHDEPLHSFNQRFNRAYRVLSTSGVALSHAEQIDHYLRSLQQHPQASIQVILGQVKQTHLLEIASGQPPSLNIPELQQRLVRQEDVLRSDDNAMRPSRHQQQPNNRLPRHTQAAATSTTTSRNDSNNRRPSQGNIHNRDQRSRPPRDQSNIRCFGCQQLGHHVRNCPTTAVAERETILRQHRQNQPPRQSNSNNNRSSTAPSTQRSSNRNQPNRRTPQAAAVSTSSTAGSTTETVRASNARVTFVNAVHSQRRPSIPVLRYEDNVIMDSGASDHITNLLQNLAMVQDTLAQVLLPDGSLIEATKEGILRLSVFCMNHQRRFFLPLMNTIYVPGFQTTLWSVGAFTRQGHEVIFGHSTVRVILNADSSSPLELHISHPYLHQPGVAPQIEHRNAFANMTTTMRRRPIDLELLHQRLGHQSCRALLAANEANVWSDTVIRFAPDPFCISCRVGTSRTANRGHQPPVESNQPGQVLYLDVIPNISNHGLTPSTHFPYYGVFVCAHAHYIGLIGIHTLDASSLTDSIQLFVQRFRPSLDFTLDSLRLLHVDAAPQFVRSDDFRQFLEIHSIGLSAAAPYHQHQNGLVERRFQQIRNLAFKMLTHARLGRRYYDFALRYASFVANVLPIRDLFADGTTDSQPRPATPYELYFGELPRLHRFRVFGCPVIVKVYRRIATDAPNNTTSPDEETKQLQSKNIIQRGIRGIFVGFPLDQAGYLNYIPSSGRLLASADVAFDEEFDSILAYNERLFHDALPTRSSQTNTRDPTLPLAFTGPPMVKFTMGDELKSDPWTPYTALPPTLPADDVASLIEPLATDSFPSSPSNIEEGHLSDTDEQVPFISSSTHSDVGPGLFDTADTDEDDPDEFIPPLLRRNRELENVSEDDTIPPLNDRATGRRNVDSDADQIDHDNTATILSNHVNDTPDIGMSDDEDKNEENNDADADDGSPIEEPIRRYPVRARTRLRDPVYTYSARIVQRIVPRGLEHVIPYVASAFHASLQDSAPDLDNPGGDPVPFLPEPQSLRVIGRLPPKIKEGWVKAFVKEISGIIKQRNSVKLGEIPGPDDKVIPAMDVYKCKLDKDGFIDKLKCRVVFRGDLYRPHATLDSWNPHADWTSLRIFLAVCARRGIFPAQCDLVQGYLQSKMRERVFVKFPQFWADYLPDDLKQYCGVPLLLLMALYGYTYSGKFLYEDVADFLRSQGFTSCDGAAALWYRQLPNNGLIMVLQYSDDLLPASTCQTTLQEFRIQLQQRFDVVWKPIADWYLQARIEQDKDKNIHLDQTRYSAAVVNRYLPNHFEPPTKKDIRRYENPLPYDFKWTRADSSTNTSEVVALEQEFGFRFIEVAGSLNWLSNTCYPELFAIRKACKHMALPGRRHFQAIRHLLHHLRCHPPPGLCYYHDITKSPLHSLLKDANLLGSFDPTFVHFSDSSLGDCDDMLSTGSYIGLIQGGIIDHNSFVPPVVVNSVAESENNAQTVSTVSSLHTVQIFMELEHGDSERPYTVPHLTDSQAVERMTFNEKATKRTRHILRRWLLNRRARSDGRISVHHISADLNLSDLGTKNQSPHNAVYKRKVHVVTSHRPRSKTIQPSTSDENTSSQPTTLESKKGDEERVPVVT